MSVSEQERTAHGYHQAGMDWLPRTLARAAPGRRRYGLLAACDWRECLAFIGIHSTSRYHSGLLVSLALAHPRRKDASGIQPAARGSTQPTLQTRLSAQRTF